MDNLDMFQSRFGKIDKFGWWDLERISADLGTVTGREKGVTTRMRTHRHARTLPNPEALVPEIEEGAVNRRLLQALFLLPWGGARTATGPGAIYPQIKCNVRGVS